MIYRPYISLRWRDFDYTSDNLYFVTSVVKNRICCFGEVIDGEMVLNEFGKIAEEQWLWLAKQYPYVRLHEFVIMPDHMHGIIEINRSLHPPRIHKIKSLSELIGAYKTRVSKNIHLAGFDAFKWQRSFYDRVIRNGRHHFYTAIYIQQNPQKWGAGAEGLFHHQPQIPVIITAAVHFD